MTDSPLADCGFWILIYSYDTIMSITSMVSWILAILSFQSKPREFNLSWLYIVLTLSIFEHSQNFSKFGGNINLRVADDPG